MKRGTLAVLCLLLAACGRNPPVEESTRIAPPGASSARAVETVAPPTQTSVPVGDPPPTAIEMPLRFTFPTPGPLPVPAWRPPPYDIPWSLRPEDHFWFARPIAANEVNWPLPEYRYGGTYFGQMSVHAGVDLDAPIGTPVLAAGAGKVIWVGWGLYGIGPAELDPYGLAIAIEHDFGYGGRRLYTLYAHLSATYVWDNEPVETGDLIGAVGLTGNTTGEHLHFEVREGRNNYQSTRNPELWLAPPQGWGVLAGRIVDEDGLLIPEKKVDITSLESGQHWEVWTYGERVAHGDDVYQENFAISDLPAGRYEVSVDYPVEDEIKTFTQTIDLVAGRTSLVLFNPTDGFVFEPTPTPRPFPTAPASP